MTGLEIVSDVSQKCNWRICKFAIRISLMIAITYVHNTILCRKDTQVTYLAVEFVELMRSRLCRREY